MSETFAVQQPIGQSEECCCPQEGTYCELARKVAISGTQRLVSQMVEMRKANVVEIDAQDWNPGTTAASVSVQLEYGNDGLQWTSVAASPAIILASPGSYAGIVTDVSARYVRLVFQGASRATRISAGIRLRTEPPIAIVDNRAILPGLAPTGPLEPECYVLVADGLNLNSGTIHALQAVAMKDYNSVKLGVLTQNTVAGFQANLAVQGSNDCQTWQNITTFGPFTLGYSAPAAVTGVSFRFVRVLAQNPSARTGQLTVGVNLSRL